MRPLHCRKRQAHRRICHKLCRSRRQPNIIESNSTPVSEFQGLPDARDTASPVHHQRRALGKRGLYKPHDAASLLVPPVLRTFPSLSFVPPFFGFWLFSTFDSSSFFVMHASFLYLILVSLCGITNALRLPVVARDDMPTWQGSRGRHGIHTYMFSAANGDGDDLDIDNAKDIVVSTIFM